MHTRTKALLVVGSLAALAAGCSTGIGRPAVTPGTDAITLRVWGAMGPPTPVRDCSDHWALYTLNRRTRELAWDFCYTDERGQRVLEPREMATVEQALARLTVVQGENLCEPDASRIVLATAGAGTETAKYTNDMCGGTPPLLDQGSLAAVVKLLYQLTGT
jgi:hypothetical protein